MKTYLLTVSDLLAFVNTNQILTKDESIRLYHTNDDTLPVSVVTYIKDMDITFVPAETPETLIFDIGVFIGEQRSNSVTTELFCGDGISIPNSLIQSLGIKKLGLKKSKRGVKSETTTPRKTKSTAGSKSKTKESVQQDVVPTVSGLDSVAKENEGKPKRTRKSGTKDEATKDSTKPKRGKKNGTKADVAVTEENVSADAPVEKTDVTVTSGNIDVATMFLKQMSVRGSDLKDEKYSDDALLMKLLEVFKHNTSTIPALLLELLKTAFTESDANTIYAWVKPNAKRLHELALQY